MFRGRRSASAVLACILLHAPRATAAPEAGAGAGDDLCAPLLHGAEALTGRALPAHGLVELRNALFGPELQVPAAAPADPGLARRALRLFPRKAGEDAVQLQLQPLAPGVWRASYEEGPAACSRERFFRQTVTGRLQSLPPPAAYGDLCWASGRTVGETAGVPVLVELDQSPGGASLALEVTPWRSEFKAACRLQIQLRRRFEVRERRCADAALCRAGEAVARTLAARFIESLPSAGRAASLAPRAAVREERSLPISEAAGTIDPSRALPDFGVPYNAELVAFSAVETRRPARIGRTAVIVRVGLASLSGRPLGEPLAVIYRQTPTGLAPAASYVLESATAEVIGAAATPPGPYVAPSPP